ncbi:MAG TPA: zinc ribbon domain-containing protein [Pedobacter sp.]|uniref:zinc ribbon domain-containing protein n=1 Tax=Pedobacter sp. TaxID=1411316 RepID=UPI002CD45138|nr:zinc ribbon domain-containing protein [Pedobacter sp.]HMI01888.1 zinc ribbon domain-containing protein [Pedobacter sp.]
MRTTHDGIDLIKACPSCDRFIPIADTACSFCGYVYEPIVLDPEEQAWSYTYTVELINDAFFRLENFGKGDVNTYSSSPFGRMFSIIFHKTRIPENQTRKNYKRLNQYYALTGQLATDFDKSNFENSDAYKNKDFVEDLEDITYINSDRYWEFLEFEMPGKKERLSITDLMEEEIIFEDAGPEFSNYKIENSMYDDFDRVRNGELTELERYNLAEKLTDNFKLEKLKLLHKDFDYYLFLEQEEMESRFSIEETYAEINRRKEKGLAIPMTQLPIIRKKGAPIDPDEKPKEVLNKEALLFPYEFFHCYEFRKMLNNKIREIEDSPEVQAQKIQVETTSKLRAGLSPLGFFDLETVRNLWPKQQQDLIKMIAERGVPFAVALLNEIGVTSHIYSSITKSKSGIHKKLAAVLGCQERTVKGNLNVLNKISREDRSRYTAHLYLDEARQILKQMK